MLLPELKPAPVGTVYNVDTYSTVQLLVSTTKRMESNKETRAPGAVEMC